MAQEETTTEYFTVESSLPLGVAELKFTSQPIRSTTTRLGGVSRTEHVFVREVPSSPAHRVVFIASLPGQYSLYINSRGASMFRYGTLPELRLSQHLKANRRWVIGVFNDDRKMSPSKDMFEKAEYFDCPGDRVTIKMGGTYIGKLSDETVREMEAWHSLGCTNLTRDEIAQQVNRLWDEWQGYTQLLWNSQDFAVCLAVLILTSESLASELPTLRKIERDLRHKQNDELSKVMVRRHFSAMAGMFIGALATGGLGAFASWGYAGFGMYDCFSESTSDQKAEKIVQKIPELQQLIA